jgi:hypothetical protein
MATFGFLLPVWGFCCSFGFLLSGLGFCCSFSVDHPILLLLILLDQHHRLGRLGLLGRPILLLQMGFSYGFERGILLFVWVFAVQFGFLLLIFRRHPILLLLLLLDQHRRLGLLGRPILLLQMGFSDGFERGILLFVWVFAVQHGFLLLIFRRHPILLLLLLLDQHRRLGRLGLLGRPILLL